jgi:D-glycero-alpha-D-manno-heptose 1-phosphate guanylyltransferase
MKVIILAGGFGTRLKHLLPDVPKPMADISGRPFLEWLMDYLADAGVSEVILSVHYLKEKIIDHFGDKYKNIKISYALENEPLGTGGAILNSIKDDEKYLIINGDTFVVGDYIDFFENAQTSKSTTSILLRKVADTARYGRVEVDSDRITSFKEKGISGEGFINAGVYYVDGKWLKSLSLPEKFSFETDFLYPNVNKLNFGYYIANDYFIDIGVPEDYAKAQSQVPDLLKKPNKALFLDRDGVINFDHDYVYKVGDNDFIDGIFDLAKTAVDKGYMLFVVTNQAGIGRGLYTEEDFFSVTKLIENKFAENGSKITETFYCPYHPEHGNGKYKFDSFCRKPNPGMILRAASKYGVDVGRSLLIGDRETDVEAAKNAGIRVKILFDRENKHPQTKADHKITKLLDAAKYL